MAKEKLQRGPGKGGTYIRDPETGELVLKTPPTKDHPQGNRARPATEKKAAVKKKAAKPAANATT